MSVTLVEGAEVGSKRAVIVRDVSVLGYRVRTATWPGDRSKTPLLMLSGIGARIDLLTPLADSLGDREVVTFEIPGSGESPVPWHPYNMPMLAAYTARLLTELEYAHEVDVLGLSWGGMLAQQFAFQHSRRCRRLVLAATSAGMPGVPARLKVLMELWTPRRFNDAEHRRQVAARIYGGVTREEKKVAELDGFYKPISTLGYTYQLLAATGWNSHWFLPLLRQPTLVMAGDSDPIIPLVNACWMARAIPNAKLHVLHDGHLFFVTSVEPAAKAIIKFLETGDPHGVPGGGAALE